MKNFFKDGLDLITGAFDTFQTNRLNAANQAEKVEFVFGNRTHSEQLSNLFNFSGQEQFMDFLSEAKSFVKQFTNRYIQEDIFREIKKGGHGLTLTLSSPGFEGFFLVRIPTTVEVTSPGEIEIKHSVKRNHTYIVEYCKNGFDEKNPVLAGTFNF